MGALCPRRQNNDDLVKAVKEGEDHYPVIQFLPQEDFERVVRWSTRVHRRITEEMDRRKYIINEVDIYEFKGYDDEGPRDIHGLRKMIFENRTTGTQHAYGWYSWCCFAEPVIKLEMFGHYKLSLDEKEKFQMVGCPLPV
jgi:hypothetical protein